MVVDMERIGIFLDRDGTISEEVGYVDMVEKFSIYSFSSKAIKRLNDLGVKVIIVTNQAGIAKGLYTEETLHSIHEKMREILKKEGARIDAVYYCPHHPEGKIDSYRLDCNCRKPKNGLLLKASRELNLNLKDCFIVGDKIRDIKAGNSLGIKSILVLTGYGKEDLETINSNDSEKPDFVTENLLEASEIICNELSKKFSIL